MPINKSVKRFGMRIVLLFTLGQCGVTKLEAVSGSLTSPGFPDGYPSDLNCIWHISLPDIRRVIILDVYTFEVAQECSSDYFQVSKLYNNFIFCLFVLFHK